MYSIELKRQSEIPIKRQIYQALKDRILDGSLKAGEFLPSTRELAEQINVSRHTVCEAYDMLITEGFVLSRQGAPTRVAEGLRIDRPPGGFQDTREKSKTRYRVDFRTGWPDLRHVPRYLLQQMAHKAFEEMPLERFGYVSPQGALELRAEISSWLFRSKGLDVDAGDIFITSGATHALHIIANLISGRGNKIAIEDPCNSGILQTFLNAGCEAEPIPVDEKGIRVECLDGVSVSAVYTTPSHQFPLGPILPAVRRAELIRHARENDIYLIEDDYDSEFRYAGEPVAPLYSMDPRRVVYVGTFSKVLFPAIRIGYVILPEELQPKWRELRMHTDVQNPPFEQAMLAEFLRTRKFDRHLRRMRKLYGERRTALLGAMEEAFGDGWRACGDAAGLHLTVEFKSMRFDEAFIKKCGENGVRIASVERHAIRKGRHSNKLLLGFGHLEPVEIREGVSILRSVIQKHNLDGVKRYDCDRQLQSDPL
ncbi:MAG: PLP-dependent aminotransferase family protein [Peptococcaceae bacterium]|nr:PLP-dependent aminotransferase family protein [Peptococcaceae bacterium]